MRIVMVTGDVQIDRRILQEAETLTSHGHDVILIARTTDTVTSRAQIGNVKVERVPHLANPSGGPERFVIRAVSFYSRCMNHALNLVYRSLVKPLNWSLQKSLTVIGRLRSVSVTEKALARRAIWYRPDCLHVHDLPQLACGVYAKRALGVPLIYDSHELYTEICTLTPRQKKRLRRRERRYLREVDVTVTVNSIIARELVRRYQARSVAVVQNAIDPPPGFQAELRHDRFRQMLPIPVDHKIILYQGWLAKFRGLGPLLEAMPAVRPDVHLVFMGYGKDVEELRRRAAEIGVSARVHFVAAVSHADLLYWTASADVGIIPYQPNDLNLLYCSPNKLYEFVQAGLPMLSNDLPFLRSVIESEGLGLVRRLDTPESFTAGIHEMVFDPQRLAQYRATILAKRNEFSWAHESQNLRAVYARLFDSPCPFVNRQGGNEVPGQRLAG